MSHRVLKRSSIVAFTLGLSLSLSQARAADDIVTTAVNAGSFKTLAAALDAAGLVEALKGEGPFTVFAPTDDAFAKLPAGTVEALFKPENKTKLAGILTYHVVSGSVPAEQVVKLSSATTLNGQRVDVNVADGGVSVDDAKVVQTDIKCSNGIIHVIDSVILPVEDNIPTVASNAGQFKTLLAAAKAAGLVEALSGEGPLTVFAPTDEAFAKLPEGTVESLLKSENRDKLVAILTYHVVEGRVYSDDAVKAKSAKTLQGQDVKIGVTSGKAMVNNAELIATDIDAANGVIHVIDTVLLPPEGNKVSSAEAQEMIEHAVSRGSKLYNRGHHAACADVYAEVAHEMVSHGDVMPPLVTSSLESALSSAESCHCPKQKAWTLRRGLDQAYAAMTSAP